MRERIILLLVITVAAILWLSSLSGRMQVLRGEFVTTSATLDAQQEILELRPLVDSQLAELLNRLEPGRTLSASRLNAELANIGASLRLNPEIPPARTEQVDRFLNHATEVLIRRTSYENLMRFADEIAGRSPYLNLEQIQIVADRSNPALLDARFRISAVELHSR